MSIDKLESFVKDAIQAGKTWEGSADSTELAYLANLAKQANIKIIGEIGFNAGLSSYAFLEANPNAVVYSFDLAEYDYVKPAKNYIDKIFPGRHVLIRGDSTQTVPEFRIANPELFFDLIFVDGSHDYEIAKTDLKNVRSFATRDTILVVDDLTPWKPWGEGPTTVWQEALRDGFVLQKELIKDGRVVDKIEPPGERSWVLGKYNI
jgi:predicted O-methyltransferase YrrM